MDQKEKDIYFVSNCAVATSSRQAFNGMITTANFIITDNLVLNINRY